MSRHGYKSPLRYPGGKSRALAQILPLLPVQIGEYREPFLGGGSVYLAVRSAFGERIGHYALNDLNPDVYAFWRAVRDDLPRLTAAVWAVYMEYGGRGRMLYDEWRGQPPRDGLERAVRAFVMNRITFSGVMDAGGYSQQAFERRFTETAIARLEALDGALRGAELLNEDYEALVLRPGAEAFIFLDPPYYSATESRLYGAGGKLHTGFDHVRFADVMRACPHRWLITYDDSPYVRGLFAFADIIEWELQYGMNNFHQTRAAKGRELFIRNY
jgi:DNA adenine methylase